MNERETMRRVLSMCFSKKSTLAEAEAANGHFDGKNYENRELTEENMKNIVVVALAVLALFSGAVSAGDSTERKKIEFLIASVEHLNGAKFIRNGTEHDGKEAAEHLRMKLQKAGDKVQTADDFIRLCASKSFLTGKPYMIRSSNGNIIKSEEFFREKLKEFNAAMK